MRSFQYLRMRKKEVLVVSDLPLYHKATRLLGGGHQELQGNQIHPLTEVKVLEAVLELQEEGEEEMVPVTPVEMKDQMGMGMLTLMKKKMKVVSTQPE